MLLIKLVLVAEWRLWPLVTKCDCDAGSGKRISLPFFELWIIREKVAQ